MQWGVWHERWEGHVDPVVECHPQREYQGNLRNRRAKKLIQTRGLGFSGGFSMWVIGPFLGTLNIRCRIIIGTPKRDHNFDNHPCGDITQVGTGVSYCMLELSLNGAVG